MDTMKPTVPKTRIGGKVFTASNPALSSALYETELARAIVGIKKATLTEYIVNKVEKSILSATCIQYTLAVIIMHPAMK